MQEILFEKDEQMNTWTCVNPEGTQKTHVRQLRKKPLIVTIEREEYIEDSTGGYWVVVLYEAVNVDEIRELYPDASDKVIRKHFAEIVKQGMIKAGWFS